MDLKYIIWVLLVFISCRSNSQNAFEKHSVKSENEQIIAELDSIAKTAGYEFVYGNDKYPIKNPLGSNGTSYLFNILINKDSLNVLFLGRKPSKFYKRKNSETVSELELFYDYSLIFAKKENESSKYRIQSIVDKDIGLKGLNLHFLPLNKDLSEFKNVKSKQQGPKGRFADYRSGSMPIIIDSESAFIILYYFNSEWYEYVERDE
jgi:hypothetical protein